MGFIPIPNLTDGSALATVAIPDATVAGGYRIDNQSKYTLAQLTALVAGGAILNAAAFKPTGFMTV